MVLFVYTVRCGSDLNKDWSSSIVIKITLTTVKLLGLYMRLDFIEKIRTPCQWLF